ncbi:MAG: heavy-metal-associated domain-containing protein [Eggerthellales bacterium]|nr:heavy-metal-associated domain-containing protein [Eggerthellales bacterium]
MRKTYKLEDLCCANCAAKIQDGIAKIDGVQKASVNFLTQKFTLVAEDDKFEAALQESLRIFKKIEPDCTVIL